MNLPDAYVHVSVREQRLRLWRDGRVCAEYGVSTAANGVGEVMGSEQTPRGWHKVRAKIGAGCAPGTVFIGRRPSGEIYTPELAEKYPERDWILTRILWLSGCTPGRNRLKNVDTMRRFIYIHGCPDTVSMGVPGSHGCVRMRNGDVIDLFEKVPAGIPVLIEE